MEEMDYISSVDGPNLLEFLHGLKRSSTHSYDDERGRKELNDAVQSLFSDDSISPSEKYEYFSLILSLRPLVLKPRIKDLLALLSNHYSLRSAAQLKIDLLTKYFQIRQVTDYMKVYIGFILEKKTACLVSPPELDCLESIFVDIGHQQIMDTVSFLLQCLKKLLENDSEAELKAATKLALLFRAIILSSPAVLQNRSTAGEVVTSVCEILEQLKKMKSEYRRFVGDIFAEVAVKLYLVLTSYGGSLDTEDQALRQALPKKATYLPWRYLIPGKGDSTGGEKLELMVTKFIRLSTHHRCDVLDDELAVGCLPDYCLVEAFWTSFLSNFSLFQVIVPPDTLESVKEEYIRPQWSSCVGAVRKAIMDFASTFPLDASTLFSGFSSIPDKDPVDTESAYPEGLDETKSSIRKAIRNYGKTNELNEMIVLDFDDSVEIIVHKLELITVIFEEIQSKGKLHDALQAFLKEIADRIFCNSPQLIVKSWKINIATSADLVSKLLDLFTSIVADRRADISKYPVACVAITCASIVPWDKFSIGQKNELVNAFDSFLKFLHICQKRCNGILVGMASNWMGVLRRLQLALINVCSRGNVDDDVLPLIYRLGRFYSSLEQCKELEKIVAFLIFDLVELVKRLRLADAQKDALLRGAYRLIRISDQYSISMITGMMDESSKEVFRLLYEDYTKYHKYAGMIKIAVRQWVSFGSTEDEIMERGRD